MSGGFVDISESSTATLTSPFLVFNLALGFFSIQFLFLSLHSSSEVCFIFSVKSTTVRVDRKRCVWIEKPYIKLATLKQMYEAFNKKNKKAQKDSY